MVDSTCEGGKALYGGDSQAAASYRFFFFFGDQRASRLYEIWSSIRAGSGVPVQAEATIYPRLPISDVDQHSTFDQDAASASNGPSQLRQSAMSTYFATAERSAR